MRFALTAERVFDGHGMRNGCAVIVDAARIADVVELSELDRSIPVRDLGDGILSPGFNDLQVNGGAGVLFNATPTVAAVKAIAAAHRAFGVTGLLPTVITDSPEVMVAAVTAVSEAIRLRVPGVLGIHIEGPFIDPKRKGAHDERFIRTPTEQDLKWLCGLDCGKVVLTLAPNMVAPATIRRLAEAGIIVSLGHSDATAEEAMTAIENGARCFTHLFNAMSQMTGRSPGMVGAAFETQERTGCSLIADGHHVDRLALRAAIRAKPFGGAFYVSDAMPSAACGPNHFELQGRRVEVVDGRLQLSDGTLAGANITMRDAVIFGIGKLGLSIEESLRMATFYPALIIDGMIELGNLAAGYRANLVHLSDDLDVLETWIDGVSSSSGEIPATVA